MDRQTGEIPLTRRNAVGAQRHSPAPVRPLPPADKAPEAHLLTLEFSPKGRRARIRGLEAGGGPGVSPRDWTGETDR